MIEAAGTIRSFCLKNHLLLIRWALGGPVCKGSCSCPRKNPLPSWDPTRAHAAASPMAHSATKLPITWVGLCLCLWIPFLLRMLCFILQLNLCFLSTWGYREEAGAARSIWVAERSEAGIQNRPAFTKCMPYTHSVNPSLWGEINHGLAMPPSQ